MKSAIITKRYAEAYINAAKKTIGVEKALEETKALRRIIKEDKEFDEFLRSPQVGFKEKCRFVDEVLAQSISPDTRDFIKLLISKERIEYLFDIADYLRVFYTHEDAVNVCLKTTFFLDNELLIAVQKRLQEKLKKKMNFFIELDSQLLGGIQVIIGNTILDGSVKNRLNELKRKLKAIEVF